MTYVKIDECIRSNPIANCNEYYLFVHIAKYGFIYKWLLEHSLESLMKVWTDFFKVQVRMLKEDSSK